MNEDEKVIKALELCASGCDDNGCVYLEEQNNRGGLAVCRCVDLMARDALELLKSQQAEIERLEKENGTLKLAVQSMPNWLDEKRPQVVRCKDCKYRNNCINTTYGIDPYGFCKWGEKDGDGE